MIPRGEFRNHATELLVQLDLAIEAVGEQALLAIIDCDTGFVAGCFNTENYQWLISSLNGGSGAIMPKNGAQPKLQFSSITECALAYKPS
jgi:hypothetical protein